LNSPIDVRLLIDAHALLWFLVGDRRLSIAARKAIEEASEAYVSAVSIWELSIKEAAGRVVAPDVIDRLGELGFIHLAIEWEHAWAAGRLPNIHRDPFDRMLVAQAIVERLTIVSRDADIARYGVPVVRA
jgi:PIN domain nuclease of toxin-antitoxin system